MIIFVYLTNQSKGKKMGQCKPIYGLKFDSYSKRMIKEISRTKKMKSLLDSAAIVGTFNAIFTKTEAYNLSLNIAIQDWNFLINALKSTSPLRDGLVQRNISLAIINYSNKKSGADYKQLLF